MPCSPLQARVTDLCGEAEPGHLLVSHQPAGVCTSLLVSRTAWQTHTNTIYLWRVKKQAGRLPHLPLAYASGDTAVGKPEQPGCFLGLHQDAL